MEQFIEPTLADVYQARERIRRYLPETPLLLSPGLSTLLNCKAYIKCENMQPVGAFKVRGGINLVSRLTPQQCRAGVITASSGNHGQSIAYAAREFGVRAVIALPAKATPYKVDAIRRLGATVVHAGEDFEDCRQWVEQEAQAQGYRYVHSMNEPLLVAGVGTLWVEVLERISNADYLIVPIGGGSAASAACIVSSAVNPRIKVIGVQAEQAPAVYQSWKQGQIMSTGRFDTIADGLAVRSAFAFPLQILRRYLYDMVLVSEADIKAAVYDLLDKTRLVIEPAGAAVVAAARNISHVIDGKKVVLLLSGGNISMELLHEIIGERCVQ